MKILMVCNQFYPALGGVETHILNLAKRFVKDGDTVEVVSSISVDGGKSGKINGVFYKKFYSFKLFGIDATTIIPSLPVFLFKNVSEYDVVHVHSYGYFVSWVTVLICRIKKKKVIYTPHYADETTLPKIIKIIYDWYFAGWSFRMADAIIALTPTEKKILLQKFKVLPKRIYVAPNGIEVSQIKKKIGLDEKKRILNKYGINTNFKTIITIGRIAKNKGQIYLIKAVSRLENLNLIIIGKDWGEEARLVKYIKNNNVKNIFIFDNVNDQVKYELLSISDMFVLPSLAGESFGIVLLEAMCKGLPVIASNIGGIRDLIVKGKNGELVKPGDVTDLTQKITDILENKEFDEIRKFCLEFTEDYNWDKLFPRIKKIYTIRLR